MKKINKEAFEKFYNILVELENKVKGRQNPLKKMQSLIVIACKILRVIFTILTKGVAYDPKKLLGDIVRQNQAIPQAA